MATSIFPKPDIIIDQICARTQPTPLQCTEIFDAMVNYLTLISYVISVTVIRFYETDIMTESGRGATHGAQIKALLRERFTAPTMGTQRDLLHQCLSLIDSRSEHTPDALKTMKDCVTESFNLQQIAQLLNDLESISRSSGIVVDAHTKPRTIYKDNSKTKLFPKLFDLLLEKRNVFAHKKNLALILGDLSDDYEPDVNVWAAALSHMLAQVSGIFTMPVVHKSIEKLHRVDSGLIENGKQNIFFVAEVKTYEGETIRLSSEEIGFDQYQSAEEYQRDSVTELLLPHGDQVLRLDVFPFFTVSEDTLYLYQKTTGTGYEYFSFAKSKATRVRTKRKFNHALFKTGTIGDRQAIFWTEVQPSVNPQNTVRANIPTQGGVEFVGRRRHIRTLNEDVLGIPNRDAIIYGPGGVGKTALAIKVCQDLFNRPDDEEVFFNNIIWASAKCNYCNPILGFAEEKQRQFESLDNILTVLLMFFGLENVWEYPFEDKQRMALEVLSENSALLILDNFESVPEMEALKIIKFFESDVKKALARMPHQFKLIITSRQQIPSSFYQIPLNGLGSKEFMQFVKKVMRAHNWPEEGLSTEQLTRLHDVSKGIPLFIIHLLAQLFCYHRPIQEVLDGATRAPSEVVRFSFQEVFKLIEEDSLQLKILILLEEIKAPLMVRQMSDILHIQESEINNAIPLLCSFQCVDRHVDGYEEKFKINDEVRMLTKSLIYDKMEVTKHVRRLISHNFSLDRQMDYTAEDEQVVEIFEKILAENRPLEAKEFITGEMSRRPQSVFLKYRYAKFLLEQMREGQAAIEILEEIRVNNPHPNLLRLMISGYMSMEVPDFERANAYAQELRSKGPKSIAVLMELSEFFACWSASIRMKGEESDPLREAERRIRYQEIAKQGLGVLGTIGYRDRTHRYFYLYAQCLFNDGETDRALEAISEALRIVGPNGEPPYEYLRLRYAIERYNEGLKNRKKGLKRRRSLR
jgi:tetratricopeptide (TPR) repeat protein